MATLNVLLVNQDVSLLEAQLQSECFLSDQKREGSKPSTATRVTDASSAAMPPSTHEQNSGR